MTEMVTVKDDVESAVTDVIRNLAAFTATGELSQIAEARHTMKYLYSVDASIAAPLWDVTIYIQRAVTLGEDS